MIAIVIGLVLVAQSAPSAPPSSPPDIAALHAAAELRRAPCAAKLAAHWPGGLRSSYSAYLTVCMYDPKVPFN